MSILYQTKSRWEWESWLISDKLLLVNYPHTLEIFVFKKAEEASYKSSSQSLTSLSEFDAMPLQLKMHLKLGSENWSFSFSIKIKSNIKAGRLLGSKTILHNDTCFRRHNDL